MIVVIGAPGSGKTSYVRERVKYGEMVVDVDLLFNALTMRPMWDHPVQLMNAVLTARDYLIENYEPAWVISTNAGRDYRDYMREKYGAEVVVMETPAAVCLERIAADGRPDGDWEGLVARWWEEYEPDSRDEVVG
jgi:5-methylcytosine-specific restriction protein A